MVTMCNRKAVIKTADLSEDMKQDSVECNTQVLEKYNVEKDTVQFDQKYNRTWHCSAG